MSPAGGVLVLSFIIVTVAAFTPSRGNNDDSLELFWFDTPRDTSFDPPQVEPSDPWVSKRALSALTRWRPLTEGLRAMLGYNGEGSGPGVSGGGYPADFVSAETRGLAPGRPVQPLRWGRRRRR